MTLRSVITGILCTAFMCAVCFLNDGVIRQRGLAANYMPSAIFGTLLFFVLAINPLLRRLHRRLAFSGREVAVVVVLVLMACPVPGPGGVQILPNIAMLPHYFNKTDAGWNAANLIGTVPPQMLGYVTKENEDDVLIGFVRGMGTSVHHIGFRDIPWRGWTRTLSFWIPVMFCFFAGSMALAVIVHRQWAHHEHIPYPIAMFTQAILPTADGRWGPDIRSRLFWIGLCATLAVHVNNWGCAWFPDILFKIPLNLDFRSMSQVFPRFSEAGGWFAFSPTVFFTIVALAYLLPASVSLSFGLSPYAYIMAVTFLLPFGITMTGSSEVAQDYESYLHAGGYLAVFAMLVYSGRHHYGKIVRWAAGLAPPDEAGVAEMWSARLFVLAFALLLLLFTGTGLDWQLAFAWLVIAFIVLVVMARIVAETGAVTLIPWIKPCVMIVGFFGTTALGPRICLTLFILSSVLMFIPLHTMLPFMANANKLADASRIKIGRMALAGLGIMVLAFAIAVPMTLYWQYNLGALNAGDGWLTQAAPRYAYNETLMIHDRLAAQGTLAAAGMHTGWLRVAQARPSWPHMATFCLALVLTLGCAIARHRLPWWPLHPIFFLLLGSWQCQMLAFSFILGWAVKTVVTRYGGHGLFQKLKPLMFGFVAGEMLACLLIVVHGALYYLITHLPPKVYNVFPF